MPDQVSIQFTVEQLQTPEGAGELNRILNLILNNIASDFNTVKVYWGYGSPESVIVAGVGSLYLRKDGGASTTLYVKESGTGATGWVAK